jgi:hypothetical protein
LLFPRFPRRSIPWLSPRLNLSGGRCSVSSRERVEYGRTILDHSEGFSLSPFRSNVCIGRVIVAGYYFGGFIFRSSRGGTMSRRFGLISFARLFSFTAGLEFRKSFTSKRFLHSL